MRWLTLPEVAEHMLEISVQSAYDAKARGELDGIVTRPRGAQQLWHPEAAWFFACHGRAAESLDEAYAWADTHPLPAIPDRREARLVRESA